MERARRTNLVLLVVALALGGIAWWQVQGEIDAREPALTDLDPAAIDHVRIGCSAGCVPREFTRMEHGWRMLAPYTLAADDAAVARLLAIAASPVRQRDDAAGIDLGKIGLDPPSMTLEFGATRIEIGTTDALRGDRFVRVDARIARVPDRFSPFLMATAESELDRRLVPPGADVLRWRIDGVEQPDDAHRHGLRAAKISPVDASMPAQGPRRLVEVDFADGTGAEWTLLHAGEAWVARRTSPALDYHLSPDDAARLVGDALHP